MKLQNPRVRKTLSADGLIGVVRKAFEELGNVAPLGGKITLADALMSAFAMFSLKDSSMLQFDKRRKSDQNLKAIFRIGHVPCDTRMREMLDPIPPDELRPAFNDLLRALQRGKALKQFEFLEGKVLLALDGTQHFCSDKICCKNCLRRVKNGRVTYYHQMVAAAIIHPDLSEVIPLAPEPICRHDGQSKNDCERNATRRLLQKFRKEHPHLKVIVVEDALSSNGPHIQDLIDLDMDFILAVKPGDHQHLYDQVLAAWEEDGRVTTVSREAPNAPNCQQDLSFVEDMPLNASHEDLRVTWMSLEQYGPDGNTQKRFDFVTQLKVDQENSWDLARGGRARWKIENETFNTLKNQGYHFEHNYGHGEQHLSSVLAMVMMLAFLVDQVQQLCCRLFQAVHQKCESRKRVWELQRSHFYHFTFQSMRALHLAILNDLCQGLAPPIPPILDSS